MTCSRMSQRTCVEYHNSASRASLIPVFVRSVISFHFQVSLSLRSAHETEKIKFNYESTKFSIALANPSSSIPAVTTPLCGVPHKSAIPAWDSTRNVPGLPWWPFNLAIFECQAVGSRKMFAVRPQDLAPVTILYKKGKAGRQICVWKRTTS